MFAFCALREREVSEGTEVVVLVVKANAGADTRLTQRIRHEGRICTVGSHRIVEEGRTHGV